MKSSYKLALITICVVLAVLILYYTMSGDSHDPQLAEEGEPAVGTPRGTLLDRDRPRSGGTPATASAETALPRPNWEVPPSEGGPRPFNANGAERPTGADSGRFTGIPVPGATGSANTATGGTSGVTSTGQTGSPGAAAGNGTSVFDPAPGSSNRTAAGPDGRTTTATRNGPSGAAGGAPATTPASYTIRSGDTFSSIAARTLGSGDRWHEIAQANPLVDPAKLKIGQTIRLPAAGGGSGSDAAAVPGGARRAPAAQVNGQVIYVVRPGDTLASIARQYYRSGEQWRTIYNANKAKIGRDPDRLEDGAQLVIPPAPDGAR